ncbi:MAG TPA: N-acetylmuramoyl-L-alanine amidase, partial [Gemmatimonadales bacterium]|nr:N-acetylmuramoyl-L-alanine amidase [Gemmatimonadales bacterium]
SPYDSLFAAAEAEFATPPGLLRAIGWVETRWQMVRGAEEFPGRPAAFGVMALRGEALERGAALAGVTLEAAGTQPAANIRAGAALLRQYAREAGGDWEAAVVRYSGIELPQGHAAYLAQVNRALGAPPGAAAAAPCPPPDSAGAPDYPAAVWRPSPNFNQRPADLTGVIHAVIVHTCEGNYSGCWSWLTNPVSQVSAHYVVNEDGSEISQLVREPDRAWHIAATYDCALNRDHECRLNGVQSNHFTVGIEHAGFASQASFPPAQLDASARLVCDITRDRNVPRDWQHILAHGQLQPENRTDPGPNWPWIPWMHRIQAHCGEIVVDDSAEFNDATVAQVLVPSAWPASAETPDYYGGGYRWAPTGPEAADAAVFSFRLDSAGARTLDARWTSGANRSTRALYAVVSAAGDTLARIPADQTAGGGEWRTLGAWTFPAGWNRVALLRRDSSGTVVVADAVRVRR